MTFRSLPLSASFVYASSGDGYVAVFRDTEGQLYGDTELVWNNADKCLEIGRLVLDSDDVDGYIWTKSGQLNIRTQDSKVLLTNTAGDDFGLLQLGGETSSEPAIGRDENRVAIRTADDGYGHLSTGSLVTNYTEVSASTYTTLETDHTLAVARTLDGLCAITLAAVCDFPGRQIRVVDSGGNASGNTITITPASGQINGAANNTITADYGSVTLVSTGSGDWLVVN